MLALVDRSKKWSLTGLRDKLVKIGAKPVVCRMTCQPAGSGFAEGNAIGVESLWLGTGICRI